jgi:hypothetical protein
MPADERSIVVDMGVFAYFTKLGQLTCWPRLQDAAANHSGIGVNPSLSHSRKMRSYTTSGFKNSLPRARAHTLVDSGFSRNHGGVSIPGSDLDDPPKLVDSLSSILPHRAPPWLTTTNGTAANALKALSFFCEPHRCPPPAKVFGKDTSTLRRNVSRTRWECLKVPDTPQQADV